MKIVQTKFNIEWILKGFFLIFAVDVIHVRAKLLVNLYQRAAIGRVQTLIWSFLLKILGES